MHTASRWPCSSWASRIARTPAAGRPPPDGAGTRFSPPPPPPPLLWPLFVAALLALPATLVWGRRAGGPDHRLLFLAHAAVVAACLALGGPALGVIDVRFVPFAQLALALLGAAAL